MTLKRYLHIPTPEPGNRTIFGRKLFADMKGLEMRPSWIAWEEPPPDGKCLHSTQEHVKPEGYSRKLGETTAKRRGESCKGSKDLQTF